MAVLAVRMLSVVMVVLVVVVDGSTTLEVMGPADKEMLVVVVTTLE